MRNHIIYYDNIRAALFRHCHSDDDHDDRYKYHNRILVAETRARGDECACKCDGDRRRTAALPRRNADDEISPSALQNAHRAGGNPTGRCVVAVETCDIPLPGGDTEVLRRIERERRVRA